MFLKSTDFSKRTKAKPSYLFFPVYFETLKLKCSNPFRTTPQFERGA